MTRRKSVVELRRDGTYRRDRHDPLYVPRPHAELFEDGAAWVADRIGLSPRLAVLRPDLAERFEVVSPGVHVDRFLRHFCRHTRHVPNGPALGDPFGLEPFQVAFLEEALEVDEQGRRIYTYVLLVEPRKNGKTTTAAGVALYMGSPADGEHRPEVALSASTLKQVGKLFGQAAAFITDPLYGSVELHRLFDALSTEIRCPSVAGTIVKLAGDGDSNHSLDPHCVVCDELHTWKTPKMLENWNALTTAQGGRVDPLVLAISTEGEGDDNALAKLLDRIESDPGGDVVRAGALTVYRNRDAGTLVHRYAVPDRTRISDLDAFVAANPAPWRTRERIAKDLANRMHDEATKMRLYGNKRAQQAGRWVSDERWAECELTVELDAGRPVAVGVDGARTRDTTAVAWASLDDLGDVHIRSRVWSTRVETAHDVFVPDRLNNDLARDFIADTLAERLTVELVFYDERYFATQADDLSDDGFVMVEMHQGKPEMAAAWNDFYAMVHEGDRPTVHHNGDVVLREAVKHAAGIKTERGWKVTKIHRGTDRERPIDALAACVMAAYGVRHLAEYRPRARRSFAF